MRRSRYELACSLGYTDIATGRVSTWRVVDRKGNPKALVASARAHGHEPQRWYFNVAGRKKPNAFDRVYYDTDRQAFDALKLELGASDVIVRPFDSLC